MRYDTLQIYYTFGMTLGVHRCQTFGSATIFGEGARWRSKYIWCWCTFYEGLHNLHADVWSIVKLNSLSIFHDTGLMNFGLTHSLILYKHLVTVQTLQGQLFYPNTFGAGCLVKSAVMPIKCSSNIPEMVELLHVYSMHSVPPKCSISQKVSFPPEGQSC